MKEKITKRGSEKYGKRKQKKIENSDRTNRGLEKGRRTSRSSKKNRRKKMRELNKRLAEEKRKALVKILNENGIETENELKEMLKKAKKYNEYEKKYKVNEYA